MLDFYKDKKVFITGHTGFKGTWLTKILIDSGAIVKGYSLETINDSLFKKIKLDKKFESCIGDVRDFEKLNYEMHNFWPDIVIHLAAQPIVKESYKNPIYTFETNVMGTVNVLEAIRNCDSVKSFLNVTTDKVYENNEEENAFKEDDKLNGIDPYANSKSCSELVTSSYQKSFFKDREISISTARAGNVIGGGDSSKDRIIPDCVRAGKLKENIVIRNPNSIRPYQHVLEALVAYLLIIEKQYNNKNFASNYNVGPNEENCITTQKLVQIFCEYWGENLSYVVQNDNGPYESNCLKLNCDKIKENLNWKPKWNIEKTIQKIVEFEKYDKTNLEKCMEEQIKEYLQ